MIAGYNPNQNWHRPMSPTQISVLQMLLSELAPDGKLAGLLLVAMRGDPTTYGYIVEMMDDNGYFFSLNTTYFDGIAPARTAQASDQLRQQFYRQLQPLIDWRREAKERVAARAKENATDGN